MLLSLDWQLFATTFTLIFVAELPDKTAFATVFLATSHGPWAVLLGAAFAFVIQSLVAVAFGHVLNFLPPTLIHYAAALLFLTFAFLMWRKPIQEDAHAAGPESENPRFFRTAWTAFLAIFIAEWGDLTQLATATLVAKYGNALTVFLAATLALWSVAAIGVIVGHAARRFINPVWTKRIAVAALAAVGLYMMIMA